MRYELDQTKYLTPSELSELERVLKKYSATDYRNTTLIWVLLHTGARCSEVLRVRVGDLDRATGILGLQGLKLGAYREIPLPPWLLQRMTRLSVELRVEERIFPISYNRLRQIWNDFRPVKKRIHSLRHTRAMGLYERSKDIRLVQKVLGHRAVSTTMIYLDYAYTRAEFRQFLC